MSLDDQFNDIAQKTISRADKVECSIRDYVYGLELIMDEIRTAIAAAKESRPEEFQD